MLLLFFFLELFLVLDEVRWIQAERVKDACASLALEEEFALLETDGTSQVVSGVELRLLLLANSLCFCLWDIAGLFEIS